MDKVLLKIYLVKMYDLKIYTYIKTYEQEIKSKYWKHIAYLYKSWNMVSKKSTDKELQTT